MNDLEKKYVQDRLTPEELKQLRRSLESTSDEQLEESMSREWRDGHPNVSGIDDTAINDLRDRIHRKISAGRRMMIFHKIYRITQMAAVILLPIVLVAVYSLYKENKTLQTDEIVVKTQNGERATITLPDGTSVTMNARSSLRYSPGNFNTKIREIAFDGEAYFNVKKDPEHPFSIYADGLRVKVLGTVFNLQARKEKSVAELTLIEGQVLLTALAHDSSVILNPKQQAILDKLEGSIQTRKMSDTQNVTAWKRKELIFKNTPLKSVIETISRNYGVDIVINHKSMDDPFTGTMPDNNINEDLVILKISYRLKVVLEGKRIIITEE